MGDDENIVEDDTEHPEPYTPEEVYGSDDEEKNEPTGPQHSDDD